MFSKRSVLIAMVALCGLLVSAAPSMAAADGKATGLITVGGKPLAMGEITLYRDNGQFVGSKVKDGKYTIDRVPAGILRVTLEGKGVPQKYASDDSTPLVVEVKEGENIFDFDIK